MSEDSYLTQLKSEKDNLDPSFDVTLKLLNDEIERVEKRGRYTEIHYEKKIKMSEKILIPVNQFPKHNFVGKLLGPGGTTLKSLQTETGTKMSILGKGSMKDKKKEEELRKEGEPKNQHLNEALHLQVEVFSTPSECHSRLAHAISELEKFVVPDNDVGEEIRQQQLAELSYINGEPVPGHPPPRAPPGQPGGRPLIPRGRAAPPGALGGRGRSAPPVSSPGSAPGRGRAVPVRGRGAPRARGPSRGSLGAGGVGRARPAPAGQPHSSYSRPAPPPVYHEEETYSTAYEDPGYDSYGGETYETQSYGGAGSETQFYDYGHGSGGRDAYDDGYAAETSHAGGYGQNGYKPPAYKSAAAPRPSSRGSRPHPYASSGRGARY